eukprot:s7733_g2.t1
MRSTCRQHGFRQVLEFCGSKSASRARSPRRRMSPFAGSVGAALLALGSCSTIVFLAPRQVMEDKVAVDVGNVAIEDKTELLPALPMESRRALLEHQIGAPSPIQALALPHISSGKHAVLISETGSGKTLAYLLPALQRPSSVMILTPTRELAIQTLAEAEEHCQGILALATLSARASWWNLMDASVIVATPSDSWMAQGTSRKCKSMMNKCVVAK